MSIIRRPNRSEAGVPSDPTAWEVDSGSLAIWLQGRESAQRDSGAPGVSATAAPEASAPAWSNAPAEPESFPTYLDTDAVVPREPSPVAGEMPYPWDANMPSPHDGEVQDTAMVDLGESDIALEVPEETGERAQGEDNQEEYWANEVAKAVACASIEGSPDAWRSVACAAVALSELAQTMERLTATSQIAAEKARAALEAKRNVERTAALVEEAEHTATLKARAAEEAESAAQRAAREAEAAREDAAKAAEGVPAAEQAAAAAFHASAFARKRQERIEAAVARARNGGSAQAWGEALRIASEENWTDETDDVDFEGVPVDSPR
jgi:hypothetical protein